MPDLRNAVEKYICPIVLQAYVNTLQTAAHVIPHDSSGMLILNITVHIKAFCRDSSGLKQVTWIVNNCCIIQCPGGNNRVFVWRNIIDHIGTVYDSIVQLKKVVLIDFICQRESAGFTTVNSCPPILCLE